MTSLRVLVVDDDSSIADLVSTSLEGQVDSLSVAASGEEALKLLEAEAFDAAFLDVDMPGISGLEVLAEIGKRDLDIEVIMMTGNATLDVALEALRLGAYDFLVKPFESMMLPRAALTRVAEKRALTEKVSTAHKEIRGLYQYYLCAQNLASALTFEAVRKAATEGLARLAGSGRAIYLSAESASQNLLATAVVPHDEEEREIPITLERLNELVDDRLETAAALRQAFKEGTGAIPRASYVLLVAGLPHSVLVLEGVEGDLAVSEDVMALFITQIEMALGNATLYEKLQDMSVRDALTGLYNHRYFQDRLTEEVARAQRHGHELSLLFLDIDDFKHLNDQHGHPAGDQVLIGVANMLRGDSRLSDIVSVRNRTSDIAARYGGEEFVMVLPETPSDGAFIKAERVRKAIEATPFVGAATQPLGAVTVSIGVATFPLNAGDKRTLIKVADQCLYEAKRQGKNCAVRPEGEDGGDAAE